MGFKMKGPSMNISYGGESNKQQKSNLLKDNPVAKHASAMNMNGSPFHIDPVSATGSETPKKKGPDWSKAPKNNSQARRDWYKKNNLAQDKTTKLKENPKVKPKVKPEVKPEVEPKGESKTEGAKKNLEKAKSSAKEGQESRQDTRKAKRISKRANRVSKREDIRKGRQAAKDAGLKGKAKRTAIKDAKTAAKKKQAEANKGEVKSDSPAANYGKKY